MSDGLSWEAIGVISGLVVTILLAMLGWLLSRVGSIAETLTKMAADLAVMTERWRVVDIEHAEMREKLDNHEVRIVRLEGQAESN
jgi:hypothetical protein